MKRLVLIAVVIVFGCGGLKNTDRKRGAQGHLPEFVKQGKFKVNIFKAYPQQSQSFNQTVQQLNLNARGNTSSMINVSGETYYLKIKCDSVFANLPFYGRRYSGAVLNSAYNGIVFADKVNNLNKSVDTTNLTADITFLVKDKHRSTEHYSVHLKVKSNKKADLSINSSDRSPMEYTGEIEQLSED